MDRTFDSVNKTYDEFRKTSYEQEGVNADILFLLDRVKNTHCVLLLGSFIDPNAKRPDVHTRIYPAFIFGETIEDCVKNSLLKCSQMFRKEDGCIFYRVYVSKRSLAEVENPMDIDWTNEYTLTKEITITKFKSKK